MVTNKKHTGIIIYSLLIIMTFFACDRKQETVHIPPPTSQCTTQLDWQGLTPGKSTREDVERVLGTPVKEGRLNFEGRDILYYAYKVNQGEISKYAMDRIFFRSDGLIDWMEIIAADRNGRFEAVLDTVIKLGNKLDTVYSNNNYNPSFTFGDVRAGPDQIYVWSNCGLALDALPSTYSLAFQADREECTSGDNGDINLEVCNLIPQQPNPTYLGGEPGPDINSIVLMKFYFQPTTYQGFTEFYMFKIPYGLWHEYLLKNR